jgi:hypothetical protein
MHLRNKETGEEFHVPSGMGKALVATGTVEEVIPIPGPEVTVEWSVRKGQVIEDYVLPPVISWHGGGNFGHHASMDGMSHLKCKSYVPGLKQQTCPKHIAEEYLRLYADWARVWKRSTKVVPPKVSEHTGEAAYGEKWKGFISGSPWQRNYELRNK